MKRYATIYKEVGETPLMALERLKREENIDAPASYAGRLDPMAEGKLLILLGEECKRQKEYTSLDKEYEIEVLFDIGSDTGDALGIVSYSARDTHDTAAVKDVVQKERGIHSRTYPAYSSKTVSGKPLFLHALEGSLGDIEIPEHIEQIYAISVLKEERVSADALLERVEAFLKKAPTSDEPSKVLGADFRIEEVKKSWENAWKESGDREFLIVTLRVACASGTYMRSLAGRLGEALGTKALALSIKRTKIGKHHFGLWVKEY